MAILAEESHVASDLKTWLKYKVFNDESVDETKSSEVDARHAEQVSLIVETGTGVSSGVVKLEGAATEGYTGTWVELGSLTLTAASKEYGVSVGIGTTVGLPVRVVRARIETVIGGGTIDAYILVQN